MTILALVFVLAAPVLFVYAYLVYPTLLWLAALFVKRDRDVADAEWPSVTVTLPVYNEERNIRHKLATRSAIGNVGNLYRRICRAHNAAMTYARPYWFNFMIHPALRWISSSA